MPIVKTKEDRFCPLCGGKLRYDRRKNEYCSLKCEKLAKTAPMKQVDEDYIKLTIEKSTAWSHGEIDKPLELEASQTLVISDVHAPAHDKKWMMRAITTGIKMKAKLCIISGDFMDFQTVSKHHGSYQLHNTANKSMEDDFLAAEILIDLLCNTFENVVLLMGNHDMRAMYKIGGQVTVQRMFQMLGHHDNLKVTPLSFVYLNGDTIVGHPRKYSRVRGNLSQKYAMANQKHVMLGHEHHAAWSLSADGKYQAVAIPCLAQLDVQAYVNFEINDMPAPINGFSTVTNKKGKSKISVWTEFSDWSLIGMDDI